MRIGESLFNSTWLALASTIIAASVRSNFPSFAFHILLRLSVGIFDGRGKKVSFSLELIISVRSLLFSITVR